MTWTTPSELRTQLIRHWQRGAILRARLTGEALFPLTLSLRKPRARDLVEHFAEVGDWIDVLRAQAKTESRHGYCIVWASRHNRVHGRNELPDAIVIDSEADALAWLGRTHEARQFAELTQTTLADFPELHDWLARHPLRALEHADLWPDILTVVAWFKRHPRPERYLRELDIPGIHTKFIETHRGLLAELLDIVLPPIAIDASVSGVRGFNRRYGLRDKPVQVRLRLLDPRLAIHGLTDLAVPVEQLAGFDPGADTVFVTENDINGLAFPEVAGALVIFGLGYGVDVLRQLPWLDAKRIYYWGDIDTHGMAILNRFRHGFAHARSLLMDAATLEAHRDAWGHEDPRQRFSGELTRLTDAEQAVYQTLHEDRLAPALRLEQEHIRQSWLRQALENTQGEFALDNMTRPHR